jgi:hypothetical protein
MLGPNVLARMEFLQSTLARAGLAGQALAAATHGLANLTIGSALTESTWRTERRVSQTAAQAHIDKHALQYPTLAANAYLSIVDEDTLFTQAVEGFLTSLST